MDEKSISVAEANRNFNRLLEGVSRGETFVVTRDGKPVAKVEPVDVPSRAESATRKELLNHLRRQRAMNVGSWTREDLYDQ